MDSNLTNYTFQFVNPNDNSILFQSTLSNTTHTLTNITLTDLSYNPSGIIQLEFRCSVTNPTNTPYFAYINSVIIYYN